jgi:hypothetical protein
MAVWKCECTKFGVESWRHLLIQTNFKDYVKLIAKLKTKIELKTRINIKC